MSPKHHINPSCVQININNRCLVKTDLRGFKLPTNTWTLKSADGDANKSFANSSISQHHRMIWMWKIELCECSFQCAMHSFSAAPSTFILDSVKLHWDRKWWEKLFLYYLTNVFATHFPRAEKQDNEEDSIFLLHVSFSFNYLQWNSLNCVSKYPTLSL